MSGIPTSGGGGDVTLAGNPNAFSGTNTFDVNRPTSTLTSTIAATDFITKQNADTLYTNDRGDAILAGANAFTSTNTFNARRPTSTLTDTTAATEFLTKQNADALYAVPRAGDIVNRQLTFFNQILSVNQGGSGYYYVDEMEVSFTPTYTNSHFKITMNCQYTSQTGARMIYVGCRLYRNFAHLTAASNANPNTTQANAACWVTHNARVNFNSSLHNNQMSGLFIDTNPATAPDGKIYYSIAIRPIAYTTTSGGAAQNQFKMNCMYGTSASSVRDPANTSQMLIEEIFVS